MAYALQMALDGLPLASIYALLAAAYSLIYGLIGRINFAFGEIAVEQLQRQRVLYQALYGAPHRPGPVLRVETFGDNAVLGGRGHFQRELAAIQQPGHIVQLDVHDLRQVVAGQRIKYDDIVNTVQKLGPELLP